MNPKQFRRHRPSPGIPVRAAALVTIAALAAPLSAQQSPRLADPMRGRTPVGEESRPAPIHPVENKDLRRERAYSMQPPTIPHKIDGYQVDRRFNRCLDCHARDKAFESRAVPLSVTSTSASPLRCGRVTGVISAASRPLAMAAAAFC